MNFETYINQHYLEAIDLLMTLGKIPAPSHKEDLRANFVLQWFKEHQGNNAYIDQAKNVICKIEGKKEETVIFMAHTDVVFEDETELPMKREGNILYAPGIGDDTANLIVLLMAYLYIKENNITPEYTLLFIANACEEGLGNLDGCKEIMKTFKENMKYFYSFDGNMGYITNKAVGSYRYKITIKTEGGHSYGAFGNHNAILEMSHLINELDLIELPKETKTTYNFGVIEGGSTVNSIAQECSLLYEFRSESLKCLEYMQAKFNTIINFYKEKGINIHVETLGIRPGSSDKNQEALENFTKTNIEIIKKHYGKCITGAGSTDANIPLSLGLIANTLGTVTGGKAHTREEWVDLESLKKGLNIALDIIQMYL